MSVQILTESIWNITLFFFSSFLLPERDENNLKRLLMLYMERLLLYASLSRNVVLFALCMDKAV